MKLHQFLPALALGLALSSPSMSQTQPSPQPPAAAPDPYLWLEDVQGERSLAWVRARNADGIVEAALGGEGATVARHSETELAPSRR